MPIIASSTALSSSMPVTVIPAGAAARVLAYETRVAEGHWEAAETRDVQKTTNHKSLDELRELCPAFDWVTYVTGLGGTEETLRTTIV